MYEITVQVVYEATGDKGEISIRDSYDKCLEKLTHIHHSEQFYLISATLVRVEGI